MQILADPRLDAVSHPLVAHMYLKKHWAPAGESEDVLVIEANFPVDAAADEADERLYDLLADLPDLRREASTRIGHFDRIDIRRAH